jgi:hypothetical protein
MDEICDKIIMLIRGKTYRGCFKLVTNFIALAIFNQSDIKGITFGDR